MLYIKTLKIVPYLDPEWLEENADITLTCVGPDGAHGYKHRVSKLALAAFSPTMLEVLLGKALLFFEDTFIF